MSKIALITIHGMGKYKPKYYSELEEKLKDKLKASWSEVSFQPVDYGMDLQKPEDSLWEKITSEPKNQIKDHTLRQFFLYGFGDAGSLEHSLQTDKNTYLGAQLSILKALQKALIDLDGDTSKPVVIIAQSLGCQVISNFIWDAKNNKNIFGEEGNAMLGGKVPTDFERLNSLSRLITTGCNIPVFVAGLSKRQCFERPNPAFIWDNFYDANDVLGWPLRQLDESYDIVNDHPINAGGIFTSWNIASHGAYWGDKEVVDHLAHLLLEQIQTQA
ncbi:MAG: hypothetical protein EPO09_11705 [Aquabacterium sp.]|uniref:hypothetical protein n=1 Tax=Aquabacterium sp. TaxID=1872578 RepID=UPI0012236347|nr:hypothetical protein [Aquabacterium sp.]TAK93725.1 MAG: hypothetical protein EPO09_11705 [Aquabacterium sp.]